MTSIKNLASGVLTAGITSSATSLDVSCGDGSSTTLTAVWPNAPFFITAMPSRPVAGVANSLDSEIMKVTALSVVNNVITMTVARAQRNTSAKAFSEGAIVVNGVYSEDVVFLGEEIEETEPTPWVTDDMLDKSSFNFGNYSTREIDTGFTWVDRKHIYKKTFTFTGKSPINHGIANIDSMVDIKCLVRTDNQWRNLPWLYSPSDAGWAGGVYVTTTSIIFQVGTSLGNWNKGSVTLEYTKV